MDGTNEFWHVSCPSTSLRVAADGAGNLLATAKAAGRPWSAPADVDGAGNVLTSKRPAGGAGAWSAAADTDATSSLVAVSCPSRFVVCRG